MPQFDRWIEEKVIAGYGIYLNHHATGAPWDVLLVFEYHDAEALGRRDLVKMSVRKDLAASASWRLASGVKRHIRTEEEVVMAAPVLPKK